MSKFDEKMLMSSLGVTDQCLDISIERFIGFVDDLLEERHALEEQLEKNEREINQISQVIDDLKLAKVSINAVDGFKETL